MLTPFRVRRGNDFFNTSEENLFTRKSFGASLFASAPLSDFIGSVLYAVFA
jgi:hypothetical protein